MSDPSPVVIEVALNGGRRPGEHHALPLSAGEVADDAVRCFLAGATVAHFHARLVDDGEIDDTDWCSLAIRQIRAAAPGMLVSMTSLRADGVTLESVIEQLRRLGRMRLAPDLMSVNLGHTVLWERESRTTVHYPNDFADVLRLLEICTELGIKPELGLMDLGYVSNAVLLRDEGLLPERPWFLVELDSPGYGLGLQVAPATVANYELLSGTVAELFPAARWAAHGNGITTYPILERALAGGANVRVGLEDSVVLPDGSAGDGNLDQVIWAASAAARHGRRPATPAETRRIIGIP